MDLKKNPETFVAYYFSIVSKGIKNTKAVKNTEIKSQFHNIYSCQLFEGLSSCKFCHCAKKGQDFIMWERIVGG